MQIHWKKQNKTIKNFYISFHAPNKHNGMVQVYLQNSAGKVTTLLIIGPSDKLKQEACQGQCRRAK